MGFFQYIDPFQVDFFSCERKVLIDELNSATVDMTTVNIQISDIQLHFFH